MNRQLIFKKILACAALPLFLASPLCAGDVGDAVDAMISAMTGKAAEKTETRTEDKVRDTVEEAMRQYEKGDYSGAAANFNYAAQLVLQKKSEQMQSLLPDAPPGWTAETAKSQALGAEILGGGLTISRTYRKDEARVHLEVMAESPVMQSILMLTSNSVFAGAAGGKLETVKGNRAIVKYDGDDQKGEIFIVVDARFVVAIKGRHVTRDELTLFANVIDYDRLLNN